ncbi:acyl-CoA carboxylase epsilon subunit [Curtobacterium sp. Leaf261]|uniref:acyl-CoA carboxylase epsilon subunit n=1 Tax=Curtobacterium sp. Leaf261 TaxID=1736311 RepID=UPI000701406B|nr:acyl-CoA carboxylase epsilon subunit [Curtobacterium sp. Leaf261]KQO62188.1 hypothetical protein ASF23_10185 [Curtobacterium sp. Leaf261]
MTGHESAEDRPGGTADESQVAPGMRVVAGAPTPEELAAVAAVLQAAAVEAAAAGRAVVSDTPRSAWNASARGLRKPVVRGGAGWRESLR